MDDLFGSENNANPKRVLDVSCKDPRSLYNFAGEYKEYALELAEGVQSEAPSINYRQLISATPLDTLFLDFEETALIVNENPLDDALYLESIITPTASDGIYQYYSTKGIDGLIPLIEERDLETKRSAPNVLQIGFGDIQVLVTFGEVPKISQKEKKMREQFPDTQIVWSRNPHQQERAGNDIFTYLLDRNGEPVIIDDFEDFEAVLHSYAMIYKTLLTALYEEQRAKTPDIKIVFKASKK